MLYRLLTANRAVLQSIAAVVAMTVAGFNLYPTARTWMSGEILVTYSFSISKQASPGGSFLVEHHLDKLRDDCADDIRFYLRYANGEQYDLQYRGGFLPKVSDYYHRFRLIVPFDAPLGQATFGGIIRYYHESDRSCNKVYTVPAIPLEIVRETGEAK